MSDFGEFDPVNYPVKQLFGRMAEEIFISLRDGHRDELMLHAVREGVEQPVDGLTSLSFEIKAEPQPIALMGADKARLGFLFVGDGNYARHSGVNLGGNIALFSGSERYCPDDIKDYVEPIFLGVSEHIFDFYIFAERDPVLVSSHVSRAAQDIMSIERGIEIFPPRVPIAETVQWMEAHGWPVHTLSDEECLAIVGLLKASGPTLDADGTMIIYKKFA